MFDGIISGGAVETIMCVIVVVIVLRTELLRKWDQARGHGPVQNADGSYAKDCVQMMRQYKPEAGCLVAFLALAAVLRLSAGSQAPDDEDAYAAWARIQAAWPVLMGADTLLALQAMLRLAVLLCTALRARAGPGAGGPVPLSEEAAALWLGAALARVALLTRSAAYQLDGPLGGIWPAVCEMAVLPPLVMLALPALRKAPLTVGLTLVATIFFASRNHLSLTGNTVTDSLFTLAHSYDVLAACAYLLRTLLIDTGRQHRHSSIATGFAHLVMPVQAALAAYYFLTAFEAAPELVGAGIPFEVLKFGTGAQFGAYAAAALVYFADREEGGPAPQGVMLRS